MSRTTLSAAAISLLLHGAFFWIRPAAPEKIVVLPAETIRIQIAPAASPPPPKPPEQPPNQVVEKTPPPEKKPKPPTEPKREPPPKPIPAGEIKPPLPAEEPVEEEPVLEEAPPEVVPDLVEETEVEPIPDVPMVAGATEVVPAPMAPLNLTPSPDMPDDGLAPFRSAVLKQIQRHRLYPKRARDRGIEGMVYVQFTIDGEGRVHKVEILPPADAHPLLTEAAMETIRKASPLPAVPDFLRGQDRIVIVLGMRFELQ